MKHLEVGGEKHYIVEKIKELSKTTSYVSKEINCKWETIYNIYVCYNCQENWFPDNTLGDIYILLSIIVYCSWSIPHKTSGRADEMEIVENSILLDELSVGKVKLTFEEKE